MGIDLPALTRAVQANCDISDATHAGQYTLCIYLLKMREYYRWAHGLDLHEPIDNADMGRWLNEREQHWETVEDEAFVDLPVNGSRVDAFDSATVNDVLAGHGLVYSAGYVLRGKPHFFLAELEREIRQDDVRILVSGRELARELSAPPALSQGETVFIRTESLRRTLWEKVEESLWSKGDSPLTRAIACYDFANHLQDSLDRMCRRETDTVVAHEIGEVRAGGLLDDAQWNALIMQSRGTPLELMLRAVRDNLADCLATLPDLVTAADPARLHFYAASLSNMRKALFPALRQAYDDWHGSGSLTAIEEIAGKGVQHWLGLTRRILELHATSGIDDPAAYARLIESNTL